MGLWDLIKNTAFAAVTFAKYCVLQVDNDFLVKLQQERVKKDACIGRIYFYNLWKIHNNNDVLKPNG